ncbi:hypothetical protein SNOG_08427 [Parastagonospora nodorum SN15]|uniref:BPL/LPL catalytic domain-containing protein n=1 Tax=Phaeosphaeria nodorum (strain SN15 / ATCC MYA-4574 / FGSC 10173) TaxID=321614 RepID=Q0UII7_PHANO|nr:hypothetical protein SNOG_08427 [Parastagonospora nodorum SN15]EAT84703.2 hypothetical protein SNOG_08427 [Parastagonospora nodorum SN15]
MASKKMNVLVYSGIGKLLHSKMRYSQATSTCALLVFPGGADLGYCRTLNGEGNRRISRYINSGGSYLGFCAGGYYGSSKCEFEVDDPKMGVVGDRELGFFPGICRGLAFAGFQYASEAGARATNIKINKRAFQNADDSVADHFKSYYNGGGVFVDADKLEDRGVEILASYTEDLHVDSGATKAAMVYRKIGEGHVVLTVFLGLVLQKLGLQVNEEEQAVPSLSRLHLTSHTGTDVSNLIESWAEVLTVVDGDQYINGKNDIFRIEKPGSTWSVHELKRAVSAVTEKLPKLGTVTGSTSSTETPSDDREKPKTKEEEIQECVAYTAASSSDQIIDYEKIVKSILPHDQGLPSTKEIPFHHEAFYANLNFYHNKLRNPDAAFGKHLLYGEVVTSTNSLLEKNPALLRNLPTGFTMTAATQIAGRGRGGNYLAALAIVAGIKNYGPGYDKIPVKLKWPNDIYAQLPGSSNNPVVKIGGILVNSSYSGSSYDLVCGIGLNLSNALPTTSLNLLASTQSPPLKAFTHEKLLASILAQFETLYSTFCQAGFTRDMEGDYYDNWLHTDQIVTLETEGDVKARIKGITRDWGLLLAEELGWEDRPTGKLITLQSDSNSFDFFRGLVRRKL